MGQFGLEVAMSVCFFVFLFVPFPCYFFALTGAERPSLWTGAERGALKTGRCSELVGWHRQTNKHTDGHGNFETKSANLLETQSVDYFPHKTS